METDTIGPAGSLSDDGGGVFAGAYPEETPAVSGGGGKKKKGKSTRWNIPQNALEMLERGEVWNTHPASHPLFLHETQPASHPPFLRA